MAIRLEVFCDEQGFSADIEVDEMDAVSTHFLLFPSADIGRVAVLKAGRMKGAGKALMLGVENEARKQGTFRICKLHSQCIAEKFYASCGFVSEGDVFDEEGCPHIMMVKKL
ncbi:GCN5-related N-acetyltransferase [Rhizoclosmatium globosum]|uniref:GCN5-related N-acetyltransferase n=1 Tax=Rhizoclosmatium globosum TaxID=329046 RepID=A0A1Y2D1T3_9FUNG|nr:GCN5-related N-acetyltransferase [Rhizoclosmatium globosum]|eukprot:ORY53242.1 GCN5-related N-acetyltransferase [Rhizoclosmatium globosum]